MTTKKNCLEKIWRATREFYLSWVHMLFIKYKGKIPKKQREKMWEWISRTACSVLLATWPYGKFFCQTVGTAQSPIFSNTLEIMFSKKLQKLNILFPTSQLQMQRQHLPMKRGMGSAMLQGIEEKTLSIQPMSQGDSNFSLKRVTGWKIWWW